MRKVGLAIIAVGLMAAGLALARSVPVARASDELPYEWTCKAQGYFAMAVEADGNVTPSVDRSETQPISVTINKRQETALTPERILLPFDLGYVLGLASQPETMFSVAPDWWRCSPGAGRSGCSVCHLLPGNVLPSAICADVEEVRQGLGLLSVLRRPDD
jgi:hypothetical protein